MIREITSEFPSLTLTELPRTICELLNWKRLNGGLKNQECRQLLERLRDQGGLCLPEVRALGPRRPRQIRLTASSDPQPEITGSAGQFEPLILTVVGAPQEAENRLWREYIERYHYLGHRVPVGAHLRYLVRSAAAGEAVLACLLTAIGPSCWKRSSMPNGSGARAIGRPTGSSWAAPRGEAGWIATIPPRLPPRCFMSILCAVTSHSGCRARWRRATRSRPKQRSEP